MLLNEFFGKPADIGKKMSKDQDDQKLSDELFWYIVDHDRLHKDFFHPLAAKMKKQQDGGKVDKEKTVSEFAPMVKKGCLEFFKSKKMKGHPEKVFHKELFKDICEKLYDHYNQGIQKDHYTLGLSESALTSPMRMQDYVKMADEIHAKMMDASQRNDKEEWHRLKQEYEQLAAIAKKGMVPESQVDEIFNPSSSLANLLRGIGAVAGDLMPAAIAGMGSFVASSALIGPAMGMMVGTTAGNAVFQAMQNQQNRVPGMIQKIIEKYFGSEAEQIEFSVLHAKSAYLGQPEFRWRGKQWPVTLEKAAAEAIVEKHDKSWLDTEKQKAIDAEKIKAEPTLANQDDNNKIAEESVRGVDAKGRTQQQWVQLVKAKFPTARIIQSKMIDGPMQAILDDGRKLYWSKVEQAMSADKQVPIGEHLELQMSKFIGRIIANEAIQNNQRRSKS